MNRAYRRRSPWAWLGWIVVSLALYWAWTGTEISLLKLLQGLPAMGDFVRRMLPPDFSDWSLYLRAAAETAQIAVLGTFLAALLAWPLSFLAARNMNPLPWLYQATRLFFDVCRGISEIIWGLLFVATVGLGPAAGVLALAVHELGALGRYFSESIEGVTPGVVEAAQSAGATRLQIVSRVVMPEIKPYLLGYLFYYLEHGIRAASVLGLVGAGGIGFLLETRISLFRYHEVAAILMVVTALVIASDRLSAAARRRVLGERSFRS
jgi:phosphonate transport system permease protein